MMVTTKEHVYCMREEGNQCRVEKKGVSKNKGNF